MSATEPNSSPEPVPIGLSARPKIGSYHLQEQLGSGGMGSVYRAVHDESGLEVAIKILPRSLANNPTMLRRFLREAQSVELLQDPNIVEIFDRGAEAGQYYIVLEYLPGGDLHGWVRRNGPLPVAEALEVVKSVARGLQHAAEQGLIHRDIKPANLLRTADGRVKVTDLGLALQLTEEDERVTRDGTTVGTVDYMAPEQARDSRATSVRSDIYSLGCTLYYLLAGQPPFPGGGLPEKLRRHAFEAPPDVRKLRPDVPEEMASLIQRMMAKKPERRFLDYEHLLMALEELPVHLDGSAAQLRHEGPVIALLDEDAPGTDIKAPESPVDGGQPLPVDDFDLPPLVELDEEEKEQGAGSSGFTVGPMTGGGAGPGSTRLSATSPGSSEPVLDPDIELAPLEEIEEEPDRSTSPEPTPLRSETSGSPRAESPAIEPIPVLDPWENLGPTPLESEPEPIRRHVSRASPTGISLGVLILRGALAALVLVFIGIGISHLLSVVANQPRPARSGIAMGQAGLEGLATDPPIIEEEDSDALLVGKPAMPGLVGLRPAAWKEPAEPLEAASPVAPGFAENLVQAIGLEGAEPGPPMPTISPTVFVERASEVQDRSHRTDLRQAFDTVSGTIEINDDGPLFEHDFRVHGRDRLIRAAKGRRPIIVARPSRLASVRDRPALLVLDRTKLTIEGIDLVIRAADLSVNHHAIFLLRGGSSLTLRDCTITVEGPIDQPMSAVQVGVPTEPGQSAASMVRFERTLIRGPGLSAAWLAEGPAEVVVSRSALLVGDAPAFVASGGAHWERSIKLLGSIVATAGPAIELAGSIAGPEANPLAIRALGNTFASAEGERQSGDGLVMLRDAPGGGPSGPPLDWKGDQNRFDGWRAVATAGPSRKVAIADFDALRRAWPGSDLESQERGDPWPSATQAGWATPDELRRRFPDLAATLAQVASPSPELRSWSIGVFEPLPEVLESTELEAQPESIADSEVPGVQWIDFDAESAPDSGDLGKYLAKVVKPGIRQINVTVRGAGWQPFTPIRLAEGVSLRLQVAPPSSGREADRLVWRPAVGARGAALIQVRDADLTILGATFERDARADLRQVVRVEQGSLNLVNCRFLAPGSVETGGGGLLEFVSRGSQPMPGGSENDGPKARLVDCVLISGGDALTANLGRGIVSLTNCAIASGSSAIVLRPQQVARDRFAADLWLDHCTIVSEADLVRLETWPGHPDGPDRPWLVASRNCAFLDPFDRGRNPSMTVLLRAAPDSLSRGALIWQSSDDAYDLSNFLAGGWALPRPVSFPDVGKLWVDLWGPSHIQGAREGQSGVRLLNGLLTPGEVAPGDLILRPANPRERGPADSGADLERLGISGRQAIGPGRLGMPRPS